jgi:hypothetical protein
VFKRITGDAAAISSTDKQGRKRYRKMKRKRIHQPIRIAVAGEESATLECCPWRDFLPLTRAADSGSFFSTGIYNRDSRLVLNGECDYQYLWLHNSWAPIPGHWMVTRNCWAIHHFNFPLCIGQAI